MLLRLVQGFAVGGEWAGSALLSAEYAPDGRRGLYGMFTLLGGGVAGIMSSLTFLGVNVTIGEYSPEFLQWGWRVPFLISGVMIALALYVRLNIDETPVFAEEKARNLVPKTPLAEVLRLQRREIVLAGGSVLGSIAFVYMGNTYLAMYAHSHLGYTRSFIWTVGALSGLVSIISVVISASLSDRVGRRRHDVDRLGSVRAVGVCGDPVDRHRQTRAVRGRDRRHVRHQRRSAAAPPGPSSPSCSPPAIATAERRWR